MNAKSVGIIGAGRIGQAMARTALRAGRHVVIANSRGRARGDVARRPTGCRGTGVEGAFVIDPTNDFDPSDLEGCTSSEVVADLVTPASVVKAANTLGAAVLGSDPHEAGGQLVIFLSGDDAEAKSEVGALFEDAGFFVVDLGGLREGGRM
jgi:predicted dinucleotide-binding enzyme